MKRILICAIAALAVFACKKNEEGPETKPLEVNFSSAVQEQYSNKEGYDIYSLAFTGDDNASMTVNFATEAGAIPMPAGKYTHKENAAAASEMTVKTLSKGEKSYKVQSAEADVQYNEGSMTYTVNITGKLDDSNDFKASFTGIVNGMQEPKRVDNIELTAGEMFEYVEGEEGSFSTYQIVMTPEGSTAPYLDVTFATAYDALPLPAGEYKIVETLAGPGEVFVNVYADETTKNYMECKEGSITVAYDEETKEFSFTFNTLVFEELDLTGTFKGEIKDMRYPSTGGDATEVKIKSCTMSYSQIPEGITTYFNCEDSGTIISGNILFACTPEINGGTLQKVPVGTFAISESESFSYLFDSDYNKYIITSGGEAVIAESENGHSIEFKVTTTDGSNYILKFDGEVTIL